MNSVKQIITYPHGGKYLLSSYVFPILTICSFPIWNIFLTSMQLFFDVSSSKFQGLQEEVIAFSLSFHI